MKQLLNKPPTPRQEQVLAYIFRCYKRGFLPTTRELGERFRITPNGVQGHIKALRKRGYLCPSGQVRLTRKALREIKR